LVSLAESCTFDANYAGAVGGAVAVDGGTFSSTECDYSGNVAGNGGAISAAEEDDDNSPAKVYVSGGTMRGNVAEPYVYAFGEDGYGGALRVQGGSEATLYLVAVQENSGNFGGGISLSAGSRVSCSEVNFSSNAARVAGGAVQAWGNGSHFLSERSLFVENVASGYTHASSDSSSSSGSSSSGVPTLDPAGAAGGAVSVTDRGSVVLLDSTFS
ncbi:unnamed protein product, partial [Laminaria digitata]